MKKPITKTELQELDELRRYKKEQESKGIVKSFARLEHLLDTHHDAVISIRAFRVIADCLLCLKSEIEK